MFKLAHDNLLRYLYNIKVELGSLPYDFVIYDAPVGLSLINYNHLSVSNKIIFIIPSNPSALSETRNFLSVTLDQLDDPKLHYFFIFNQITENYEILHYLEDWKKNLQGEFTIETQSFVIRLNDQITLKTLRNEYIIPQTSKTFQEIDNLSKIF